MVDAYGIHLGPLYIRFYALILIGGMIAAAWLTARRAPAHGLDADHVWNGLMWAIIPGLIGARIYHILTPSPASGFTLQYYLENPLQMLAIWNGGLGIYGAIAGGVVGLLIYGARHRQPILRWFDVIVPGVALAQAIGRWGNFINHELYGAPTTLPWAVHIPPEARMPGYAQFETFHPLFLYESLWNLGACLLLIFLDRRFGKWLRPGDLFLIYLAQYPIIRFLLDFLRLDSHLSGNLTTAQIVSLVVCAAALGALVLRRLRPTAARQPAEAEQ
jgi:phosphatidylglycerol:prolipoprotein diacylglycerol transferase